MPGIMSVLKIGAAQKNIYFFFLGRIHEWKRPVTALGFFGRDIPSLAYRTSSMEKNEIRICCLKMFRYAGNIDTINQRKDHLHITPGSFCIEARHSEIFGLEKTIL